MFLIQVSLRKEELKVVLEEQTIFVPQDYNSLCPGSLDQERHTLIARLRELRLQLFERTEIGTAWNDKRRIGLNSEALDQKLSEYVLKAMIAAVNSHGSVRLGIQFRSSIEYGFHIHGSSQAPVSHTAIAIWTLGRAQTLD